MRPASMRAERSSHDGDHCSARMLAGYGHATIAPFACSRVMDSVARDTIAECMSA